MSRPPLREPTPPDEGFTTTGWLGWQLFAGAFAVSVGFRYLESAPDGWRPWLTALLIVPAVWTPISFGATLRLAPEYSTFRDEILPFQFLALILYAAFYGAALFVAYCEGVI